MMPMRWLLLLSALAAQGAEMWTLDKLYTRPYVWGTSPEGLRWSRRNHVLGFLWNHEGHRFRDLYAYRPASRKLVRLTRLEGFKDDLLLRDDEKDPRRKQYLAPPAGLSTFSLSDDGALAAFSFRGELFTVPTDGSSEPFRLTRTRSPETSPMLSPDGKRLAAIENGQVVIHNLATGQLWQVTDVESPASLLEFTWSPDGERIAYWVRKKETRRQPLPNYSGRFVVAPTFSRDVAGDKPEEVAAYVVSSGGGKPVALDLTDWGESVYTGAIEWSPDSRHLLWRAVDAQMKKQRLLVAAADTGKTVIAAEDSDPAWVYWSEYGWSPDSQQIWFNSERDGWAHLYRVARSGGAPQQITRGAFETRGETFANQPQWVADGLYYSSTEDSPSERHFYRVSPDGSGKKRLSTREGINDGLVSEDGRHTAWRIATLDHPFDLWVDDHRVTTSPRPEFTQLPWPKTRFVEFPSRGSRETVRAKMLLPPGYDPASQDGKRWPCVFFIHGAGYATSVLKQWGSYMDVRFVYNAWLASQGYVVMDVDYRGSSGYGRAWRTGVYLHMGGPDLADVLGAVDYLESLGNIDKARLGIWGISYGGFMTNMALFLAPGTFKAGSSWAAVNDWENYNAFYTTQRLNTPQSNPEAYRRSSPIHFSANLRDQLLIIHGMVDSNVLFQDAVQLTEKLVQEGKDFAHIYYPQEDHGFVRDETWIDALRRTTEWFNRHLR